MGKNEELDKRKKDHIELALSSQINGALVDQRFNYEPLLSAHPHKQSLDTFTIGGKMLDHPIWISSMTGGTAFAAIINKRLAQVCNEFGLGMGLGSCRIILHDNQYLKDFAVRKEIGDQPLYANLGIAQMEEIVVSKKWQQVKELIHKLEADGLIIHINPLQEWLQPEGDRIKRKPIDTIKVCIDKLNIPVIVKEVGQGMGPKSLEALMQLPVEAIEFAALGGTNFSKLEIKRSSDVQDQTPLIHIGHTANEMVQFVNSIGKKLGKNMRCKKFIISGGIKNYLDGYYLMNKINYPAIYGQASGFLTPARKNYASLQEYTKSQIEGLKLAHAYLKLK